MAARSGSTFISTGRLPAADRVQAVVEEAHDRFRSTGDGRVSEVYPALAEVPSDLFGLSVTGTSGGTYVAGDADRAFAIMSVSKPFAFALVCEEIGEREARERIGANATGLPFNDPAAVETSRDGRTNPMVNPGAIATTSLAAGSDAGERWRWIVDGLSAFAGHDLGVDEEIHASASATNHANRRLAQMLAERGRLAIGADEAVALYTRQCSLSVTARDLSVMGATLANGGVNPITGVRVVGPDACHATLAVMITSGLYETSGDWLYEIGLPAKSGIGGGIVTVSPGKGGLGTFSPPLDAAGNSVRGQQAARFLSRSLGMDLLVAEPAAG